MAIGASELILNGDGSIYHLNLLPRDISDTILLVGDPDRVPEVSKYFDRIAIVKQKREFLTHTGFLGKKQLTVTSTGIGSGNIDIVLNELDALVNFDFETREPRQQLKKLSFVRIGTSGAIQPDIPTDTFLLSKMALGFDGLLNYYDKDAIEEKGLGESISAYLEGDRYGQAPYAVRCSHTLEKRFDSNRIRFGTTATCAGFYGPQGRQLRLAPRMEEFRDSLASFSYRGQRITNLEMESAPIYGLSMLLGHEAISLNAILANRPLGTFSRSPKKTIDSLIELTLELLLQEP